MSFKRKVLFCAILAGIYSGVSNAAQINTFEKLVISADDYSFSARIGGRLHADANFYDSGSDQTRLKSGAYIRRARIGLSGNLYKYEYVIEFDMSDDQASLKDANIQHIIGPGKVWVGQAKISESIEQVTSSNDTLFIERSYLADVAPSFKIGAGYNGTFKEIGYAADVYNMRESSDEESRPTDSGLGVTGRAFFAPVNERNIAFHVGGSYSTEHTDSTGTRVRVSPAGRAQDYRDGSNFRFVLYDRRDERAHINRGNLELLGVNGPLSVQAEYMMGSADTNTRAADDFHVWYAQVGYVLTGEWRRYDFRNGRVRRPEPSREIGAVEIAARYQYAEREKVAGAELTLTEFGVTYYPNNNVRFMINYGMASNKLLNDDPKLLSMRAQIDF